MDPQGKGFWPIENHYYIEKKLIIPAGIFAKCVVRWPTQKDGLELKKIDRKRKFKAENPINEEGEASNENEVEEDNEKELWTNLLTPLVKAGASGINIKAQQHISLLTQEKLSFHCVNHHKVYISLTAQKRNILPGADVEWTFLKPKQMCNCVKPMLQSNETKNETKTPKRAFIDDYMNDVLAVPEDGLKTPNNKLLQKFQTTPKTSTGQKLKARKLAFDSPSSLASKSEYKDFIQVMQQLPPLIGLKCVRIANTLVNAVNDSLQTARREEELASSKINICKKICVETYNSFSATPSRRVGEILSLISRNSTAEETNIDLDETNN